MPHNSQGYIYSTTNSDGSKVGINTDDVSTVLGVASHDLVTLCTHERNNKWSKHKPVRGESPVDYTVWNAATGRVREVVGFPIVWGMTLPFNTTQQLSTTGNAVATTALLKPLALRCAGMLDAAKCVNVRKYDYMRPVAGVDYSRLTDYDGYKHKAPEAWTAGVSGATPGGSGSALNVDAFDTAEIGFFLGRPQDSDISFKDLYGTQGYRFIVELYKNDASFPYDNTSPVARLVATQAIADMDYGQSFSILVSRIKALLWPGDNTDSEKKLYAILGVVRFAGNPTLTEEKRVDNTGMGCAVLNSSDSGKVVAGEGSVPPWSNTNKPFVCHIKIQSYSKLALQVLKYAKLIPTSDTYKDLPTSATGTYGSDGFRLQVTVQNKGTSTVTLNGAYSGSGVYPPKIQIQATGAFDTSAPSYSAMCLSPVEGKWHDVVICPDAACQTTGQIAINAGASATAYFRCEGVMPIGRTSGFTFRVSTDNGVNWYITGRFSAAFLVS